MSDLYYIAVSRDSGDEHIQRKAIGKTLCGFDFDYNHTMFGRKIDGGIHKFSCQECLVEYNKILDGVMAINLLSSQNKDDKDRE